MKRLLLLITPFIFAMMAFRTNTITVSGKITDRNGTALKEIAVVVKGNTTGTVSSKDGKYKLTAVKSNDVLVFSATGFKTFEVPVKGRTMIDVILDTSVKLSGIIKDKNGAAVGGATVKVKGSKTATASAGDGTYNLFVDKGNVTLEFTSVGFEAKEVKTKNKTVIDVTLDQTVQALQEVVVVGYGVQRKRSMTAAVSSISSKDISSGTLQGKAAGVYVNGATAGSASKIRIRGAASVNASNGYNQFPNTAYEDFNTESYDKIAENSFHKTTDNPLSTFSIDVDAASYSNVRRFLNAGQLPPAGAVRIEEMVNYFKYDYPQPANDDPFSINTEMATAPWNKDHKVVLIGLQGKKIEEEKLPACNLVFLIDVSGSMMSPNKLPLVKQSMKLLVGQLRPQDKVAMVVYAGNAGLVLPSTKGTDKNKIKEAIDELEAGGSTAGGAGIKLAYKTAKDNFIKNGNNRVILCTDGDFNIGESSDDAMKRLIEEERKSGVFLTVLGYGMGNYKDSKMQKLADKGNGNHAYIDGLSEAKKVLVNEFGGTMFAIAKDVKLQVEFNPAKVQGYRLIGYENRILAKEDFNDDKKDAGELGSGHTVTALYEIIPVGVKTKLLKNVDTLKYSANEIAFSKSNYTDELMTVKFRYKKPDGDISTLLEYPVKDNQLLIINTSDNFRFAAAVAEFGMLLRNSEFKFKSSYSDVLALARKAKGNDEEGYRSEFIQLVKSAETLANEKENESGEEGEE